MGGAEWGEGSRGATWSDKRTVQPCALASNCNGYYSMEAHTCKKFSPSELHAPSHIISSHLRISWWLPRPCGQHKRPARRSLCLRRSLPLLPHRDVLRLAPLVEPGQGAAHRQDVGQRGVEGEPPGRGEGEGDGGTARSGKDDTTGNDLTLEAHAQDGAQAGGEGGERGRGGIREGEIGPEGSKKDRQRERTARHKACGTNAPTWTNRTSCCD